jgi:hypothetical protein
VSFCKMPKMTSDTMTSAITPVVIMQNLIILLSLCEV